MNNIERQFNHNYVVVSALSNLEYENHIKQFYRYLKYDWKRWIFFRIKNTIFTANSHFILCKISLSQWERKYRFQKIDDRKYYHEKTRILITDPKLRDMIDFIHNMDFLDWVPNAVYDDDKYLVDYDHIMININYSKL